MSVIVIYQGAVFSFRVGTSFALSSDMPSHIPACMHECDERRKREERVFLAQTLSENGAVHDGVYARG